MGTSAAENSVYQFNRYGYQYYAVFSANLIMLSHGCVLGWISPALPVLASKDTPFETGPITLEQISWIASLSSIGAMIGGLTFGFISNAMGAKRAMATFLAVPVVIHWLVVIFQTSVYHLFLARILAGWTGASVESGLTLFVSEVSDDRIRGRLGSCSQIARNTGFLLAFVVGANVDYATIPFIFIWLPIIFFVNFLLLPSTPQYLIRSGRLEEAMKSLKFYKRCKGNTPEEVNALEAEITRMVLVSTERKSNSFVRFKDLCEPQAIKAICIVIMLTILNQTAGCFTFLSYAHTIFHKSGSNLGTNMSSILLAIVQISASFCTTQLADRLGRKILLIVSLLGCCVGLSVMAVYLYLDDQGIDMSDYNWIPVASLTFVIFIGSLGIIPLTFVCIVENLPSQIRIFGVAVGVFNINLFAFLSVKSFPILSEMIHMSSCMGIYAIASGIGAFLICIILEETKGRNLDTIGESKEKIPKSNQV